MYDKQDNQARDIKLCHTLRVKSFLNPSACQLDKQRFQCHMQAFNERHCRRQKLSLQNSKLYLFLTICSITLKLCLLRVVIKYGNRARQMVYLPCLYLIIIVSVHCLPTLNAICFLLHRYSNINYLRKVFLKIIKNYVLEIGRFFSKNIDLDKLMLEILENI